MSFSDFGTATGPSSGLRFASTRGRIQNGNMGMAYPSPFFDIAHTYLPATIKQMFRWCRYYFMTNPLINATVFKLSEYPITDIIIDHPNKDVVTKWTEYFQDHFRYRSFQTEFGLDYNVYGNGAMSVAYPFQKMLRCTKCGFTKAASTIRQHWVFTNHSFRLSCPSCYSIEDAAVKDEYIKNPSGIKLLRWNVEDIEATYNDLSGKTMYFYNIPPAIRGDITIGKKDVVENIPQVFIQAMKEQKGIVFSESNFFHMRRPSLADQDRVWGLPLLLPVLKDTFYLQLMKKAQEAILLEHIVPLRMLFPQAGSGSSDPFTTINLTTWKEHVAMEIARWRYDQNYIPILPLPVGTQTMGGDGRSLLMTGEIQQWSEQILVGMGVPKEFVYGGMSYAGTNVSMRMLENNFLGYIMRHLAMARFVMKNVATFLDWPEANIRFKPFKMADDIQRKAYLNGLNQAGKISDATLLADADLSQDDENAIMLREADSRIEVSKKNQLAMAELQGEQSLIMAKYQIKAQQETMKAQQEGAAPGEPGTEGAPPQDPAQAQQQQAQQPQPGQPEAASQNGAAGIAGAQSPLRPQPAGADASTVAWNQAQAIARLPEQDRPMAMANLQAMSPDIAGLVVSMLKQMGISVDTSQAIMPGVDMRPPPEQRAPRRDTPSVLGLEKRAGLARYSNPLSRPRVPTKDA